IRRARIPIRSYTRMAAAPKIAFAKSAAPAGGTVAVLTDAKLGLSGTSKSLIGKVKDFERIAKAARFTGKAGSALELFAPAGTGLDRLIVFGLGRGEGEPATEWVKTGGQVLGRIGKADRATILVDIPPGLGDDPARAATDMALGARMRAYRFDRYTPKKTT